MNIGQPARRDDGRRRSCGAAQPGPARDRLHGRLDRDVRRRQCGREMAACHLPLGEVASGRTLFAFLTVAAIVLPRAGWGVLRTRRYREQLQRGLSQFGSMLCWFLAVSVLSLGSATALGFAAPLFTTLLSIVILKEKVGIHCWSALIVGFVGVLIITHPGSGTLTSGALFALG